MTDNRMGIFSVHHSWIDADRWQKLAPLFAGAVVVYAQSRYDRSQIEYAAYHPSFLDVGQGGRPEDYVAFCQLGPLCEITAVTFVPEAEAEAFCKDSGLGAWHDMSRRY